MAALLCRSVLIVALGPPADARAPLLVTISFDGAGDASELRERGVWWTVAPQNNAYSDALREFVADNCGRFDVRCVSYRELATWLHARR